jgi:uncharacterized oligopeptide transporter (OPT) family protein
MRDLPALLFGTLVSALLAGTFVIAGLKAGITPGVSPLVILCAWGIFGRYTKGAKGARFLNLAQVAGSGGMQVTAGVIFTAPVIQIVYRSQGLPPPAVDVFSLIFLSLAGSLLGFGLVGLSANRFLTDPTLPAPEAHACDTMILAAVSEKSERPKMGLSLVASLLASFLATALAKMGALSQGLTLFRCQQGAHLLALKLPMDPLLIGIGGLLTLPTASLVFGGAMLRLGAEFAFVSWVPELLMVKDAAIGPTNADADVALRWTGGGTMLVAVLFSLAKFLAPARASLSEATSQEDPLLSIPKRTTALLRGCVLIGLLMVTGWLLKTSGVSTFSLMMALTALIMASIMTTLGAILSLQIGSSASPVSGTIFVTTLVLCVTALALGHRQIEDVLLLTPLMVAACVAVCSANDSSQDFKTLQLGGIPIRDGFLAQLLGLLAGCLTVPIVLYVADSSFGLGSDALPAPQGKMFATLVTGVLLETRLPIWPIVIGLFLGLLSVIGEVLAQRKNLILPSMALAVGIYLPSAIGAGIITGSLFRFFGERASGRGRQSNESILTAAGLITGSTLLEFALGVSILFGLHEASLAFFSGPHPATALFGITMVGALLFYNSRRRKT